MEYSVIVCSRLDPASMNIRRQLLEIYNWYKNGTFDADPIFINEETEGLALVTVSCDSIHAEYLNSLPFKVKRFIFATRHESVAKVPSLLAHFPGNWLDDNRFGGKPKMLSIADPVALKTALKILAKMKEELNLEKYDVTAEVTHHGPTTLKAPVVFIEIGSDYSEWNDPKAAQAVAHACYEVAKAELKTNKNVALGFGGTHYAPKFTKILLNTDNWFLSHMASKYVINETFDPKMIGQAIKKSVVPPKFALLDWKGLNKEQRDFLMQYLKEFGLNIMKARDVFK